MTPVERQAAALERIADAVEALIAQQKPPASRLRPMPIDSGMWGIGGWAGEPELAPLVGMRFYSEAAAQQAIAEAMSGQA